MTPKDSDPSPSEGAGGQLPVIGELNAPTLLAVSGGADSMAMAALALATPGAQVTAVATFDHGTGPTARQAAAMVEAWAAARGVPVHVGRTTAPAHTEAAWRAARWRFLRRAAARSGATHVATAHTADDQAETVFMRLLRGSGVRGLAGLLAPARGVTRPVLAMDRGELRRWAAATGVPVVDDPANLDRRHLRVRVRLELLPAILRQDPGFRDWLLALGARAAAARASGAAIVDELWQMEPSGQSMAIPRRVVSGLDPAALGMLWAEAAGRVGVVLDRRGTDRLVSVTTKGHPVGPIPLSGGGELRAVGSVWTLVAPPALPAAGAGPVS